MGVTAEEDARSVDVLDDFKKRSKALEFALIGLKRYRNIVHYAVLEELKKQFDAAIKIEEQVRKV